MSRRRYRTQYTPCPPITRDGVEAPTTSDGIRRYASFGRPRMSGQEAREAFARQDEEADLLAVAQGGRPAGWDGELERAARQNQEQGRRPGALTKARADELVAHGHGAIVDVQGTKLYVTKGLHVWRIEG